MIEEIDIKNARIKKYTSFTLDSPAFNNWPDVKKVLKLPNQYRDIFSQYDLINHVRVGIYEIGAETIRPTILTSQSYCFLILKKVGVAENVLLEVVKLISEIHQDVHFVKTFQKYK